MMNSHLVNCTDVVFHEMMSPVEKPWFKPAVMTFLIASTFHLFLSKEQFETFGGIIIYMFVFFGGTLDTGAA